MTDEAKTVREEIERAYQLVLRSLSPDDAIRRVGLSNLREIHALALRFAERVERLERHLTETNQLMEEARQERDEARQRPTHWTSRLP